MPLSLQHYELHRNDCRHYINCLVKYTTGREQAASACLASQWQRARQLGTYGLATSVVRLTQFFTDLANWGKVQVRLGYCSEVGGRQGFSRAKLQACAAHIAMPLMLLLP